MSADLLREAAARMRANAEAPTVDRNPWWPYERHSYWGIWASAKRMGRGRQMGTGRTKEQARYIASWHPAVALAVADWLDHEALVVDDVMSGNHTTAVYVGPAFEVARAYLGRDA